MKRSWLVVLVTTAVAVAVAVMIAGSSSVEASEVSLGGLASVMASTAPPPDWLVTRISTPVSLTGPTPHLLVLSYALHTQSQVFRSLCTLQLTIAQASLYDVGAWVGEQEWPDSTLLHAVT